MHLLTEFPPIVVAMDTSYLTIGKGGIARYINRLLEAFREADLPDLLVREVSYPIDNHEFTQPVRMLKTLGREFLWQPFVAPLRICRMRANVFHAPFSACVSAPAGVPKIATLHDLAYLATPERFRRWTRLRIPIELAAFKAADHLICPSQSTADDAIRLMGVPARKIDVIHHGCPFDLESPERPPDLPLPQEFFLFVSSLESGKNLHLLNEVYAAAETTGCALPPLIIVGKRVEGVAGEGRPHPSWHYLGRASDEALVWLYRRARALIYPSKFEGFGFPVLEAMALGTTVVCSPVSSLPEVGGDVPYYAEQSSASYLRAMRLVLKDDGQRDERIAAGRLRATQFKWSDCARHTAELYRQVAERGPC